MLIDVYSIRSITLSVVKATILIQINVSNDSNNMLIGVKIEYALLSGTSNSLVGS